MIKGIKQKEHFVFEKIRNAPSYPQLVEAYKRFQARFHGKEYWERQGKINIEEDPTILLTAHAGVMNAKSEVAKRLKLLAENVLKETKLPRTGRGVFRGSDFHIYWEKIHIFETNDLF